MAGPWDRLPRATLGTCEPDLAGWLVHPAETLSAVAYLVTGLALWSVVRENESWAASRVPGLVVVMGLGSMLFHSSFAAVFQAVDLASVFLLTGHLMAMMLVGWGYLDPRHFTRCFAILGLGGAVLPFLHLWLGFAGLIAEGLAALWLGYRNTSTNTLSDYRTTVWLLLPGATLLGLDHAHVGCVRGAMEHVIQPHVAWHLLSAGSVFFLGRVVIRIRRS